MEKWKILIILVLVGSSNASGLLDPIKDNFNLFTQDAFEFSKQRNPQLVLSLRADNDAILDLYGFESIDYNYTHGHLVSIGPNKTIVATCPMNGRVLDESDGELFDLCIEEYAKQVISSDPNRTPASFELIPGFYDISWGVFCMQMNTPECIQNANLSLLILPWSALYR